MDRIVLICDENYVMPTEVMVQSICESAKTFGGKFVVSVCSWELSDASITKLENHANENVQVEVVLVDVQKYKDKMHKINQNSHVTPTALMKFELANLFPNDNRILYLDGDMVVKGNINELFDIPLGNSLVAASYEFWKYLLKQYQYTGDNTVPEFYFNSGVMMLNAAAFRRENISEFLWKTKFEQFNVDMKGKFALMDQDVFNAVCKGRVVELPIRFNCNTRFTHDVKIEDINKVFHTSYKTVREIAEDAIVLHYVGKEDKPWKYADVACQDVWDNFYREMGYNPAELNRVKPTRTAKYYIDRTMDSIRSRGVLKTIRYTFAKLK